MEEPSYPQFCWPVNQLFSKLGCLSSARQQRRWPKLWHWIFLSIFNAPWPTQSSHLFRELLSSLADSFIWKVDTVKNALINFWRSNSYQISFPKTLIFSPWPKWSITFTIAEHTYFLYCMSIMFPKLLGQIKGFNYWNGLVNVTQKPRNSELWKIILYIISFPT